MQSLLREIEEQLAGSAGGVGNLQEALSEAENILQNARRTDFFVEEMAAKEETTWVLVLCGTTEWFYILYLWKIQNGNMES